MGTEQDTEKGSPHDPEGELSPGGKIFSLTQMTTKTNDELLLDADSKLDDECTTLPGTCPTDGPGTKYEESITVPGTAPKQECGAVLNNNNTEKQELQILPGSSQVESTGSDTGHSIEIQGPILSSPPCTAWIGSWNCGDIFPTVAELDQLIPWCDYDIVILGSYTKFPNSWIDSVQEIINSRSKEEDTMKYHLLHKIIKGRFTLLIYSRTTLQSQLHGFKSEMIWETLPGKKNKIKQTKEPIGEERNGCMQITFQMGVTPVLLNFVQLPSGTNDEIRDTLLVDSFGNSSLKPKFWSAQQFIYLTPRVFLFGHFPYGTMPITERKLDSKKWYTEKHQKEKEEKTFLPGKSSTHYEMQDILEDRLHNLNALGFPTPAAMLLACFQEASLSFPPTSTFKNGEQEDPFEWSTRVLFKKGNEVSCSKYTAFHQLTRSGATHAPIVGIFNISYIPMTEDQIMALSPPKTACCSIM